VLIKTNFKEDVMKSLKKSNKSISYKSAAILATSLLAGSEVHAAGKAPTAPSCGPSGTPTLSTPQPVRKIIVRPIDKIVGFNLPNGSTIDFSADLQTILNTAVTSSAAFAPSEANASDPCNSYLELRSALTTFQMNVANVGIIFGYTPTGASSVLTSIKGTVGVNIGTIAMDFSVWSCAGGQCSAVVPATATQLTAGVTLSATIDFGVVTTGPALIYNTPLGDIMRSIMVNGINQLAASSRLNELPWQAQVKEYNSAVGTLVFDAGAQDRLFSEQTFMVYAPTDTTSSGVCNPWNPVAYIHSTSSDTVSSTGLVDQILDSTRGIQVGDIVMIRNAK
jgi:hypothetical protein